MNSTPGYETDRFAGRYALGKNLPTVSSKNGMQFEWRGKDQPVRVLGGASSGKSAYAEELTMKLPGAPVYLATAQGFDDECEEEF